MSDAFASGYKVMAITNTWIALVLIACIASVTVLVAAGKLNAGSEQVFVGVILGHVGTLSAAAAGRSGALTAVREGKDEHDG